jgi:hypothetical protein
LNEAPEGARRWEPGDGRSGRVGERHRGRDRRRRLHGAPPIAASASSTSDGGSGGPSSGPRATARVAVVRTRRRGARPERRMGRDTGLAGGLRRPAFIRCAVNTISRRSRSRASAPSRSRAACPVRSHSLCEAIPESCAFCRPKSARVFSMSWSSRFLRVEFSERRHLRFAGRSSDLRTSGLWVRLLIGFSKRPCRGRVRCGLTLLVDRKCLGVRLRAPPQGKRKSQTGRRESAEYPAG